VRAWGLRLATGGGCDYRALSASSPPALAVASNGLIDSVCCYCNFAYSNSEYLSRRRSRSLRPSLASSGLLSTTSLHVCWTPHPSASLN